MSTLPLPMRWWVAFIVETLRYRLGRSTLVVFAVLAVLGPAALGASSYVALPDRTARGFSADGSTVVGRLSSGSAFTYTTSTSTLPALPGATSADAVAVSNDGSVVVGRSADHAVRWVGGVIEDLGVPTGWDKSEARLTSASGGVVVGLLQRRVGSSDVSGVFRWTGASGVQVLALPSGDTLSEIVALSEDGRVCVAHLGSFRACRWVEGSAAELFDLPAGARQSRVEALSADGSLAIGSVDAEGCRWTGLAPEFLGFSPLAISSDGQTIAGLLSEFIDSTFATLIRKTASGQQTLGRLRFPGDPVNGTPIELQMSADGEVLAAVVDVVGREEVLLWDAANGLRALTPLFVRRFLPGNPDGAAKLARHRDFSLLGVRHVGGKIILAGGIRTLAEDTLTRAGWRYTLDAPTSAEPNPFAGALLDRSTAFTPAVSLSESLSYRRHYVRVPFVAEPDRPLEGKLSASLIATVSMAGVDVATLDAATPVQCIFGSFTFSRKLGDDPAYVAGATRASFDLGNGTLKCAWDARKLTMTVKLTDPAFSTDTSPALAAPLYLDAPAFPETHYGVSPFDLRIGDRKGSVLLPLTARVSAYDGDFFATSFFRGGIVKVTAKNDVTPPQVKIALPAERAVLRLATNFARIEVADAWLVPRVEVRLNGGPFTEAVESPGGTGNWVAPFSPQPGVNVLEVRATDLNGNESALIRRTFTYEKLGGSYQGLISDGAGVVRGAFSLVVAEKGSFTGKFSIDGKSVSLRGALAADGTATVQPVSQGAVFTVALAVAVDGQVNAVTGTVAASGGATWAVDAARVPYEGRNNFAPEAGRLTLLLSPSGASGTPPGFGHASLSVAANGQARLAGRVADGTPWSVGSAVDGRGKLAVHTVLYRSGRLSGRLAYRDVTGPDNTLDWMRPASPSGLYAAGFATTTPVFSTAVYDARADGPLLFSSGGGIQANLVFSGGGLASPVTVPLFAERGFGVSRTPGLTLVVKSPVLSGQFIDPATRKARPFSLAAFSGPSPVGSADVFGVGYFVGATEAGLVELSFAP